MPPLPEKRQALILSEIKRQSFVSIAELERQLDVSRETIRSDISALAEQNMLQQVRGGATRIEKTEATMSERASINHSGKHAIAKLVANIIPDGASVIIDSGSTTQAATNELTWKSGLTIYTNDLTVALNMIPHAKAVHVLGGLLHPSEHSTRGVDTIEMLSNYQADFALIGVGGLSAQHGFTDYDRDAANMRDAMIEAVSVPVLLAGQEKFGKTAPVKLRNAEKASVVATDVTPDKDLLDYLRAAGLDVLKP